MANTPYEASTSALLAIPRDRSENPGVGGSIPSLPTSTYTSFHGARGSGCLVADLGSQARTPS